MTINGFSVLAIVGLLAIATAAVWFDYKMLTGRGGDEWWCMPLVFAVNFTAVIIILSAITPQVAS